jgi:hypothetical protein
LAAQVGVEAKKQVTDGIGTVNLIGCERNEAAEHADSYAIPALLVISAQA